MKSIIIIFIIIKVFILKCLLFFDQLFISKKMDIKNVKLHYKNNLNLYNNFIAFKDHFAYFYFKYLRYK